MAARTDCFVACEKEWSGDYRMQAHCIDKERGAFHTLLRARIMTTGTHEQRNILGDCLLEWKDLSFDREPGAYDWRMVKCCYERQIQAREYVIREGGR
jgi:hypothetical protein